MRVWLTVLPALAVLTGGCARQVRTPAGPGPAPRAPGASIVSADPSPTGTALAIGLSATRPTVTVRLDRTSVSSDALWVIDLHTGAVHNLPPAGDQGRPDRRALAGSGLAWRPDGGALALVTPEGRIVIHDTAGGAGRIVSPEGLWCYRPTWSPDGRRLAFTGSRAWSPGTRSQVTLYIVLADGSARPRPQVTGLVPPARWWWSADGRRLRYLTESGGSAERADAKSIAEPVLREEVSLANAIAWSPDRTKLAYSSAGDAGRGSLTRVVDASFAPLVEWHDAEVPARELRWSLDGEQVIVRNGSGKTCLLDLASKTGAVVDDPVASDKQPAGWIRWNGKQQLVFIDEQWKRLVVMESVRGPAYTLVTLSENGSPSLALSSTKGN